MTELEFCNPMLNIVSVTAANDGSAMQARSASTASAFFMVHTSKMDQL